MRFGELPGGFSSRKPGTITEARLRKQQPKTVYKYVKKQDLSRLVIFRQFGAPIVYKGGFLQGILEQKPQLSDLTELCTVKFPGGECKSVPKAKLQLCGSRIENLIRERKEGEPSGSLVQFEKILRAVETGFYDSTALTREEVAFNEFMGFIPPTLPAPLVIGQNEWKAHLGTVGATLPLTKEILDRLYGPCPLTKVEEGEYYPRMGDTHVFFWMPPTLNDSPLSVKALRVIPIELWDEEVNKPIASGYWLAMYKKPMAEGLLRDAKMQYLADHCPGYAFPRVLEAISGSLMNHLCTKGARAKGMLGIRQMVPYTMCEESSEGKPLVVGALSSSAFDLKDVDDGADNVGVCPVIRFI